MWDIHTLRAHHVGNSTKHDETRTNKTVTTTRSWHPDLNTKPASHRFHTVLNLIQRMMPKSGFVQWCTGSLTRREPLNHQMNWRSILCVRSVWKCFAIHAKISYLTYDKPRYDTIKILMNSARENSNHLRWDSIASRSFLTQASFKTSGWVL